MQVHRPPPNSSAFLPSPKSSPVLTCTTTQGLLLRSCSNQRTMQICKPSKAVFTQGCAPLSAEPLGLAVLGKDSFGVITTSSGQQRTPRFPGLCCSFHLQSPQSPGTAGMMVSVTRKCVHPPTFPSHMLLSPSLQFHGYWMCSESEAFRMSTTPLQKSPLGCWYLSLH